MLSSVLLIPLISFFNSWFSSFVSRIVVRISTRSSPRVVGPSPFSPATPDRGTPSASEGGGASRSTRLFSGVPRSTTRDFGLWFALPKELWQTTLRYLHFQHAFGVPPLCVSSVQKQSKPLRRQSSHFSSTGNQLAGGSWGIPFEAFFFAFIEAFFSAARFCAVFNG